MVVKKYFGTDGIRGCVGKYPITPEFILKLGWAAGRVLAKEGRDTVLIGKDTRVSGYMFESALEAGLSAAGVDVRLLGPLPTPGIAYLTRTQRACAGIVISASHNLYQDNGIKFFSGEGYKIDDQDELAIEHLLGQPMITANSDNLGKAERVDDAPGRYIEYCKSTVSSQVSFRGLKIVIDCANGATYQVAPSVFRELGAEVIEHGIEPNGYNINLKCGSTHPDSLQQKVLAENADLGIAFDGDGDRLIMVDHQGNVVDGDELLYIIAKYKHDAGELNGGVIGTLMTNMGFEKAMQIHDIAFERTPVGDRYVLEALLRRGWQFGGEQSGHLICLEHATTGDGIISALQVLSVLVASGRSLAEAKVGMKKYPQVLVNVRVSDSKEVLEERSVKQAVADAEQALANNGRVLIRMSGTEPLARVMVEGEDLSKVQKIADSLAEVIKETCTA